jgi:ribosomal protein S18 acetylase RimI-like enzyme
VSVDPSRVTYRDAAASDAAALAALARDTFVATFGALYPREDLSFYLAETYGAPIQAAQIGDPDRRTRLAAYDGGLIGYCGIGPMKLPFDAGGRRACEVHTLYVVEAAKGLGVARALMDWALARARDGRAQDLYLGVYADNRRAQRFYAHYGFEIVGRYDFPVGATLDDERIMRLRLAE